MVEETTIRTKWPLALGWSKVMSHWVQTWPRRMLNMDIIKSPTLLETHNTISCWLHQHDHLWKQTNKETSLSILWTRINIKHVFLYNFLLFGMLIKARWQEANSMQKDFYLLQLSYSQKNGCAMGSPMSATVTNLYMEKVENRALTSFKGTVPSHWLRYVDNNWIKIQRKEWAVF